ncbi:N-acetyltransferase [Aurantimonas sp. Leaf443]|uniref:GNAT family N-acetyltransferase n=1 Tax=Aurantimonas sp. Leaf443 TaxID=1736378 RepID=UPI0006FD4A3D|nr:N-acetyltransferase [Aurantimonas sp. Leaf443]KQT85927.1 acetyltransferase [Aurantimonas sp. Leaf443]
MSFALSLATPFAAPFFVKAEAPAHAAAREALLDAAMGPGRTRKSSEAIRRGRLPAEGLAFVALDSNERVAGTVRLWSIFAGRRDGRPVPALLLGPLAVDPALSGAGLGTSLMHRALAEAAWQGHEAVLLVGDPGYYERFGFTADKAADLSMPGPFERHRFQGLELKKGALAGANGLVVPCGRRLGPVAVTGVALTRAA